MKEFYGKASKMAQDGNREIKNGFIMLVDEPRPFETEQAQLRTIYKGAQGEIHQLKIRFKLSKSKDLDLWENIHSFNTYPNRRFNLIVQEINNVKYQNFV